MHLDLVPLIDPIASHGERYKQYTNFVLIILRKNHASIKE